MKTETKGLTGSSRSTKVRKTLLIAVISILTIVVCFAGYTVISLYNSLRSINPNAGATASSLNLRERINILVVGVDSRATNDPGRSDSIMLIGLDPASRTMSVMSIPRDSRVTFLDTATTRSMPRQIPTTFPTVESHFSRKRWRR